MIDVWLFDALCLAYLVALPLGRAYAGLPRFQDGQLADPEEVQRRYDRRSRWRDGLRICILLLTMYFWTRSLTSARQPSGEVERLAPPLMVGLATLVLSLGVAMVIRYRRERVIVRDHPEFADSIQPVGLRALAYALVLVPIMMLCGALLLDDLVWIAMLLAAAIVILLLGQRVVLAEMVRRRIEVPFDSSLGMKVAEAVEAFGYTPKRFTLLPNLVANGYAMPDGSVAITTALEHLLEPDEVAAVLAHELSHARDRDAKRLQRARAMAYLPIALVAGGTAYLLLVRGADERLLMPTVILTCLSAGMLSSYLYTRYWWRIEYKCDRDVKRIGYEAALATGLQKIYRYLGSPLHWKGSDRYLITHPSLAERLEALE